MLKFKGRTISKMTGKIVKQTEWYTSWEKAYHQAKVPDWKADLYKIEVIDRWEEE